MRWLLAGAGIASGLAIWATLIIAIVAWNHATHKRPAGGEPPALPRSGERSPLPGPPRLVPPPPATHPGILIRLVALYDCGTGHCAWIWRGWERGWQHELTCPPKPSDQEWEDWLASLPREDT